MNYFLILIKKILSIYEKMTFIKNLQYYLPGKVLRISIQFIEVIGQKKMIIQKMN